MANGHRIILVRLIHELSERPAPLQDPQNLFAGDPIQIGQQRPARGVILTSVAQQRQKNLLRHIISGSVATAHQKSEAEDAALVPMVKSGKRLLDAGRHQPKQFVITWSHRSSHRRLRLQLSADMGNSPGETKYFQNNF